jgi:hypothetical protein
VTQIVKSVLGDDYNYDSTVSTTFSSLLRIQLRFFFSPPKHFFQFIDTDITPGFHVNFMFLFLLTSSDNLYSHSMTYFYLFIIHLSIYRTHGKKQKSLDFFFLFSINPPPGCSFPTRLKKNHHHRPRKNIYLLSASLLFFIQNSFRALYRTFTQCCFIEDEGDIVFYKNSKGEAARVVADDVDIRDYNN